MEKWQKDVYDKEDAESLVRSLLGLHFQAQVMEKKLMAAQSKLLEYEARMKEAQSDVNYYRGEAHGARKCVEEFQEYLSTRFK